MKQIQQISDSELILMRIIWEKGGTSLYAEIAEALEKQGYDWKKNTNITFLSRLVDKGMLTTSKIGRRNEYKVLVTEAEYSAAQIKQFVDKVYEGNVKGLVSTLLEQDLMTGEDLKELQKFWDEANEK